MTLKTKSFCGSLAIVVSSVSSTSEPTPTANTYIPACFAAFAWILVSTGFLLCPSVMITMTCATSGRATSGANALRRACLMAAAVLVPPARNGIFPGLMAARSWDRFVKASNPNTGRGSLLNDMTPTLVSVLPLWRISLTLRTKLNTLLLKSPTSILADESRTKYTSAGFPPHAVT